jgi:hypothetical protein
VYDLRRFDLERHAQEMQKLQNDPGLHRS